MSKSTPKFIQYLQRNPDIEVTRTATGWLCCNGRFELELTMQGERVTVLDLGWRGQNGRTPLAYKALPDMTSIYAAFALAGGEDGS